MNTKYKKKKKKKKKKNKKKIKIKIKINVINIYKTFFMEYFIILINVL